MDSGYEPGPEQPEPETQSLRENCKYLGRPVGRDYWDGETTDFVAEARAWYLDKLNPEQQLDKKVLESMVQMMALKDEVKINLLNTKNLNSSEEAREFEKELITLLGELTGVDVFFSVTGLDWIQHKEGQTRWDDWRGCAVRTEDGRATDEFEKAFPSIYFVDPETNIGFRLGTKVGGRGDDESIRISMQPLTQLFYMHRNQADLAVSWQSKGADQEVSGQLGLVQTERFDEAFPVDFNVFHPRRPEFFAPILPTEEKVSFPTHKQYHVGSRTSQVFKRDGETFDLNDLASLKGVFSGYFSN